MCKSKKILKIKYVINNTEFVKEIEVPNIDQTSDFETQIVLLLDKFVSDYNEAAGFNIIESINWELTQMNDKLIIHLEDEIGPKMFFRHFFTKKGYTVLDFSDASEANEANQYKNAKVIISDFDMAGENALSMLRFLQSNNISTPVIMHSGNKSNYDLIKSKGLDKNVIMWADKDESLKNILEKIESL